MHAAEISRTARRLAAIGALLLVRPQAATLADDGPPAPLTVACRVVARDLNTPVADADIVVERRVPRIDAREVPRWAGEERLKTDAGGRFSLVFPPEQQAETRLKLVVRVRHPKFVGLVSTEYPLSQIKQTLAAGAPWFLQEIAVEPGVEYAATVVGPDGSHAAGVKFEFNVFGRSFQADNNFAYDTKGVTDPQGQIRVRLPRAEGVALYLTPDDPLAPFQRYWGPDTFERRARYQNPDLGRIALETGEALSGRVLDASGRPIAGLKLEATGRGSPDRREAVTDAEGRFRFAALRPASYSISAADQVHAANAEELYDTFPAACPTPILPRKVIVLKGVKPAFLEMREPPTVRLTARFSDSQGRPVRGIPVTLAGQMTAEGEPIDPQGELGPPTRTLKEMVNKPVTEDPSTRLDWVARLLPDGRGEVAFLAPKGLRMVFLTTLCRDENLAIKTRFVPGEPSLENVVALPSLEEDIAGIAYTVYRCPSVDLTVRQEEGKLPANVVVQGVVAGRESQSFAAFEPAGEGRYRGVGIFPDEDYILYARAEGHVAARTPRMRFAEGGSASLSLTLLKSPLPLIAGDVAPPILVRTSDDRRLSLADFPRRFVLVNFWARTGGGESDLTRLKAIHDRYGKDERFAMLGLNLDDHAPHFAKVVKDFELGWPQAMLDTQAERLLAAFGDTRPPFCVLVGPDGRLIATGLRADAIDKAVEGALGAR